MQLITYNFEIYRGAAWSYSFAPLNDDGTAVDLSAANARMMIKGHPDDATEIIDLSPFNGRLTVDNVNHKIVASISSASTGAMTFTKATYDLLIDIGAVTYIAYRGVVTLVKLSTELPMQVVR